MNKMLPVRDREVAQDTSKNTLQTLRFWHWSASLSARLRCRQIINTRSHRPVFGLLSSFSKSLILVLCRCPAAMLAATDVPDYLKNLPAPEEDEGKGWAEFKPDVDRAVKLCLLFHAVAMSAGPRNSRNELNTLTEIKPPNTATLHQPWEGNTETETMVTNSASDDAMMPPPF